MASIKKTALVGYTPAQMFKLVDDIEEYPGFLPWCKSTVVHSRTEDEVKATITVTKSGIQHSFTTLNRLIHPKMIEVRLYEGPFRHLEGFWRFDSIMDGEQEGCQVSFDLEFEFSNKFIGLTVGPVLQKIAETFVDAFCQRAKEVYK